MSAHRALWITEAEVVALMHLGEAIDALERGFELQASNRAANMSKTQVSWEGGHTLHALGASATGAGIVGTKTWAHAAQGATPLLILWDVETGRLAAVIEAFALGQMRTGGVTGVATRWMARAEADTLAIIGSGKQALTQVAAVAAVRPLRQVRVFSPTAQNRRAFVQELQRREFGFDVIEAGSACEAARGSAIIILATRARAPFFDASMADEGAHINAIGAISPERQEFDPLMLNRADLIVADDPQAVVKFSREFMDYYAGRDSGEVQPLSAIVAGRRVRSESCDLSLFKAMGMGLCDVALGIEVLRRAAERGAGRPIDQPARVAPRLRAADTY